ncbi:MULTISPECIES: LuxR family transcriptional regulator [Streptacidiphilus]|uniref:AAA family ATPase n=1 Tax=Streptacidiphilus cavernicola TaxID=3342716 RepID=A0ABV6UYG6_9ACTN|nr:LuxR family transcriptional regulator [Streptacidiphilus jeojiense]
MSDNNLGSANRDELRRTARDGLRQAPGLLLTGPAGIGKSHLLDQLAQQALARGVRVLRCSPAAAEVPLPFMCLIDLLEPVSDETVGGLPAGQREALRAVLLRGDDPRAAVDGAGVHLAVLTLLRRLCAEGPVWLVVDDIQWMDGPTAQILGFVSRRTAGLNLRVLASERVPHGQPPAHAGLCPAGSLQLTVPPLDSTDLTRLLEQSAGAPLPAATVREIARLSRGNPLYALELLRSLPAAADRTGTPTDIPGPLRALLLDRLRTVPEEVVQALVLASAAARPDLTLLATAGDESVAVHLETAERLGLLRIDLNGQIRFDDPLIGSALYAEASGQARRAAHARLATAVTEPVERARHLALANPARDEGVATTLAVAADAARRRGAPATAAELSALALARTPADAGPVRAQRRIASAQYACDAGLWDDARREAQGVLNEEEDPTTRIRARIVLLMCAGQALEGEGRLIADGLVEAAGSPALEAQLRCWASDRDLLAGRVGQAAVEARRAAALAEAAGGAAVMTRVEALTSLAYLQRLGGDQDAETTLAQALAVARAHRVDHLRLWETLSTEAIFHLHADRLAEAEASITATLDRFGDQVGVEDALRAQILLTDIRNRAGDCAGALAAARRAAALSQDIDGLDGPVAYAAAAAEATNGSLDRARLLAEEGARSAQQDGDRFWYLWNTTVLGRVHLLADEPGPAAAVLREVRSIEQSMGIVDPGIGRWHPDLAEALVGEGSLAEAGEFIDEVSATARRLGRLGVLAGLQRAAALRCLALGELTEAEELLAASVDRLRQQAIPLELARSLVALADLERRRRRHAAARRATDEAWELCRTAGALPWLRRIEQGRVPRSGSGAAEPAALTVPEQRIAALAAAGSTNREIAAACFVSVKTVEASLSRVYRKLGVRSRTELVKTLTG